MSFCIDTGFGGNLQMKSIMLINIFLNMRQSRLAHRKDIESRFAFCRPGSLVSQSLEKGFESRSMSGTNYQQRDRFA